MKTLALHSKSATRKLIKPGLLLTASILALTVATTANAGHGRHGYNGISSISLGFTYSPGGHRYYRPYRQPHNYVRYSHYYPASYSHYRPSRGHGYRYRKVHRNRYYDD